MTAHCVLKTSNSFILMSNTQEERSIRQQIGDWWNLRLEHKNTPKALRTHYLKRFPIFQFFRLMNYKWQFMIASYYLFHQIELEKLIQLLSYRNVLGCRRCTHVKYWKFRFFCGVVLYELCKNVCQLTRKVSKV